MARKYPEKTHSDQSGDACEEPHLNTIEFKILSYFIARKNRWISRSELFRYLWGGNLSERAQLESHLENLKKKSPLFADAFQTRSEQGYCLSLSED